MLFSFTLFALSLSSTHTINKTGFTQIRYHLRDEINIDLDNGNNDCLIIFGQEGECDAEIVVYDSKGKNNSTKLIGESVMQIRGSKTKITVETATTFLIWVFPRHLCPSHSMLYVTTRYVDHHFKFIEDIPSACIFFGNLKHGIDFRMEINSTKTKVQAFANTSIPSQSFLCRNNECAFGINYPFFLQLNNITNESTSIHTQYSLHENDLNDLACDFTMIPLLEINSNIQNFKKVFSEQSMKCYIEKFNSIYRIYLVGFTVIALFGFILIILVACGCYRTFILRWNSPTIGEGPAKINIDPETLVKDLDPNDLEMMIDSEDGEEKELDNNIKNEISVSI